MDFITWTGKLADKLFRMFCGLFLFAIIIILSTAFPFTSVLVLTLFLIIICAKYKFPYFPLMLFILSFFLRLALVTSFSNPPFSDYEVQYNAAKQLASGDFSYKNLGYFQVYGYQMGLVVYEALLLKIHDSLYFLKIINCLLSAGSNVLLYLIAKTIFGRKPAQITSILYCFYIFSIAFTSVLSNQHPAIFLTLLACYYLIKDGKERLELKKHIAAGTLIAFANALRPDGPIIIVSVFVYFFLLLLMRPSKVIFIKFTSCAIAYLIVTILISHILIWTNISEIGLKSNSGYWNIVLGLNSETAGTYNDNDARLIEEYEKEYGLSIKQAQLKIIKERIQKPPLDFIEFLYRKSNILWWDTNWQWALGNNAAQWTAHHPSLWKYIFRINQSFEYMVLVLCIPGFWLIRGKQKAKYYLIPFAVFSTVCVYLFWEVQPRYALFARGLMFIIASGGIQMLLCFMKYMKTKLPSMIKGKGDDLSIW